MIHGLDTGFLVAIEVAEHPSNKTARAKMSALLSAGDTLAIAPQVIAEFLHIVTDSKRFVHPLDMPTAIGLAEQWWTAAEVTPIFPDDRAVSQFFAWLRQHSLGRKRLLDTSLAATYLQAGVTSILTTNPADFSVLSSFQCVTP